MTLNKIFEIFQVIWYELIIVYTIKSNKPLIFIIMIYFSDLIGSIYINYYQMDYPHFLSRKIFSMLVGLCHISHEIFF